MKLSLAYFCKKESRKNPAYSSSRRAPGSSAFRPLKAKTLGPGVRRGDDVNKGYSWMVEAAPMKICSGAHA